MTTTSETGHAKNIANANLLNTHIALIGDKYNPSNPKLAISNLQTLYQEAFAKQEMVNNSIAPYSIAVDKRENIFAPLSKKITKLRRAYKATEGVSAAQLDNFMTISHMLKGSVKTTATPTSTEQTEEAKKQRSSSQLSYDKRSNNIDLLISLLQNTENYAPNEIEYQIATLQAEKAEMLKATQAVLDAYVPLNQARDARNKILYQDDDSLIAVFGKAKDYLFTILDVSSSAYKAIAKVSFKKI